MSPKDVMLQVDADNVVIDNSWLWASRSYSNRPARSGSEPLPGLGHIELIQCAFVIICVYIISQLWI